MATVYRKTVTKPLPDGAELFIRKGQRFARWKTAKAKTRTAPVTTGKNGSDRIVVEARTFTAKYRDGSGVVREVSTGCRDETAARAVLAELERRAELVKAGVMTDTEETVANHQRLPVEKHLADYEQFKLNQVRSNRCKSIQHAATAVSRARKILDGCGFI
ncbi:MAG: site-specific integrase, partial [Phycisphaerae bacterium]